MDNKRKPIYGSLLEYNPLVRSSEGVVTIPGKFNGSSDNLVLNKDILSKHLMMIGGTGCGKSNVFYHIVSQLKRNMGPNDVMIIFDTKEDYYKLFFDPQKDCLIGNSLAYQDKSKAWNLFREILSDGRTDKAIDQNTQEMSWSIFREAIDKSKDPFFPNAARDLFAAVVRCIIKKGFEDTDYMNASFYNSELKKAFEECDIFDIKALIESYPEFSSVLSYIGDGTSGQALGVYAELQSTVRKILTGVFAEKGAFSMRNFVRERGGRTLFVEYDLAIGNMLAPMYSLLFDLALKEAMGRDAEGKNGPEGNVYFICDEFKLLPFLQHIEDGVNFGRSLGVKVLAGLQSVNQLTEAYGEYRGKNILAGFSTVFGFKANDTFTREYLSELFGKNYVREQYMDLRNSPKEENREAHVVEDWDMNALGVGEAIIGMPFKAPFKYYFDLYKKG